MKVRHWPLFWAIRVQSRPSSSCSVSFNAYVCLACRLFRSGSPTKILYVFAISPMRTTHPIYLTLPPPSKVRYSSQHLVLKPQVCFTLCYRKLCRYSLWMPHTILGTLKKRTQPFAELKKAKIYVTQNLRQSTNLYVTEHWRQTLTYFVTKKLHFTNRYVGKNMCKSVKT
jgi:hypothetical protein